MTGKTAKTAKTAQTAILEATSPADWDILRGLFRAYAESLGMSLEFQGFSEELRTLPGKYQPPGGAAYLAAVEGEPAGCIALRPFTVDIAEMKRLFILPRFRKLGLGRRLAERVIERAKQAGYRRMYLDTGPDMISAQTLYRSLGFVEREAYYNNPYPGIVYMELRLS